MLATETASGLLLVVAAVVALVWANSPWQASYRTLWHTELGFALGRLVVGPLSGDGGLREHLAANLYLPLEALDLQHLVELPAAARSWTPVEQAKWLKLIGAGLRVERKAL